MKFFKISADKYVNLLNATVIDFWKGSKGEGATIYLNDPEQEPVAIFGDRVEALRKVLAKADVEAQ